VLENCTKGEGSAGLANKARCTALWCVDTYRYWVWVSEYQMERKERIWCRTKKKM